MRQSVVELTILVFLLKQQYVFLRIPRKLSHLTPMYQCLWSIPLAGLIGVLSYAALYPPSNAAYFGLGVIVLDVLGIPSNPQLQKLLADYLRLHDRLGYYKERSETYAHVLRTALLWVYSGLFFYWFG